MPLRHHLFGHSIETAFEVGWSSVNNGELLITTDQQLRNQQNLADRQIALPVLLSTSWPRIQSRIDEIRKVVDGIRPREYQEITI